MPPEFKGSRLGECKVPPTCGLYSDRGFVHNVSDWSIPNKMPVQIHDMENLYLECHPDSSCLNNGGWTNIYFTTFISSALYPGGVTWSLFSTFYNGDRLPPSPNPPPSPSPPSPPPNCPAFLPPPCLTWFSKTNNCCAETKKNTDALQALLAAIKNSTDFAALKAEVR